MIDLHVHSTASDGLDTPELVVAKAVQAGITVLSLTDHDTVAGLAAAARAAATFPLTFIPGIEITTDYLETEVHLLGYFIDYTHPGLIQGCADIHYHRRERAKEILAQLRGFGYELEWTDFPEAADPDGFIGRSHIMDKLIEKGLVAPHNRDLFFDAYLSKTGKAYVPHYYITPRRGIELIIEAGGVAVLAHPGRMIGDWDLRELVKYGLGGIEVWYPAHSAAEVSRYFELGRKYGLIPTGGTDYHGRGAQVLGMEGIPEQTILSLREACKGGEND